MDTSWDAIETFFAVLAHGHFSGAAKALGVGQPTVSRRIAALERQVGERLFERSRAGAIPTAAAARLRGPARQMAEAASEFQRWAAADDAPLAGVVRLAAPPGWAYDFLAPLVGAVRARHPAIRLHLLSSIDYVDLTAGAADLAIRSRPPNHHALVEVARLGWRSGAFAAPEYLADRAFASLADYDWICWAHPFTQLEPRGALERLVPDFEPAFASDSYLVQLRAAQAGAGAIVAADVSAQQYGLVPIPTPFPSVELWQYFVAARSAYRSPRVRAVAQVLLDALGPQAAALGSPFIAQPAPAV